MAEAGSLVEGGLYLDALGLLRRAMRDDADLRLSALAADIAGLVDHLESREAFAQAYETDYAEKKEVRARWKRLERWVRTATGRRTRKLIQKTVAFPRFQAMERRILETGARDILDVGCHDGAFAISLGSRQPELCILGIDIAAITIQEAQLLNRCGNVRFARMFAEDLPTRYPVPAFDLAIISHTLEHVIEVEPVVAAVERVVRPGGTLFIAVPAGDEAGPSRLVARDGQGFRKIAFVHTVRRFTRHNLLALFGTRPECRVERVGTDGRPSLPDERGRGEYFVAFRVPPSPASAT